MPTITTDTPILDSGGKPFNGFAYCRVTKGYVLPTGEVTRLGVRAVIKDGHLVDEDGTPFTLPATPDDAPMQVNIVGFETRGGAVIDYAFPSRLLRIPEISTIEWVDLPYAQGFGPGGYWWDLSGGADFPEQANVGDFGVDPDTGEWFQKG
jgi:hypothetical protein